MNATKKTKGNKRLLKKAKRARINSPMTSSGVFSAVDDEFDFEEFQQLIDEGEFERVQKEMDLKYLTQVLPMLESERKHQSFENFVLALFTILKYTLLIPVLLCIIPIALDSKNHKQ